PRLCRPAARGSRVVGARSGARLNSLRCAALKQTPHLFPLRAPTPRRYTDGDPNGNCNGNDRFKSNCNCNCTSAATATCHNVPPETTQKSATLLSERLRCCQPGAPRLAKGLLVQLKVLPSAARRASSGAGCHASPWLPLANFSIAITTLGSPTVS